ncbi:hypothetical protein M378DRAFT_155897 [Amanita muscaria Koide BX008]|uniref:Uncharacterized protein n=1 Tax=Amanita muscaria (strain Koide BX008) TaxID=946122 RepID=A0A0C2T4V3_AMAMK|nr:hypothetical protein M378DRAFT_155897 [Amanita muscaria Koide BX008]
MRHLPLLVLFTAAASALPLDNEIRDTPNAMSARAPKEDNTNWGGGGGGPDWKRNPNAKPGSEDIIPQL